MILKQNCFKTFWKFSVRCLRVISEKQGAEFFVNYLNFHHCRNYVCLTVGLYLGGTDCGSFMGYSWSLVLSMQYLFATHISWIRVRRIINSFELVTATCNQNLRLFIENFMKICCCRAFGMLLDCFDQRPWTECCKYGWETLWSHLHLFVNFQRGKHWPWSGYNLCMLKPLSFQGTLESQERTNICK